MKNKNKLTTDTVQRFLFEKENVRGEWVTLDKSLRDIMNQHAYPTEIRLILGQVLTASALLTAMIKFKGSLTIQFQSQSAIKLLVAKCNQSFEIRGLAQWQEMALPSLYKQALGKGELIVTIEDEKNPKTYQSIVPLKHDTVAHALEEYFRTSEQLDTRIWLACTGERSVGFLLQKLPLNEKEDHIEDAWEEITLLADTLQQEELLKWECVTLLSKLYGNRDIQLDSGKPITFHCPCNYHVISNAVSTIGREEALKIIEEQEVLAVSCEYCGHKYEFTKDEIQKVFTTH